MFCIIWLPSANDTLYEIFIFLILDYTCHFHKHKKYNIWFIEKNYKIHSGVYKENSKEVRGHHLNSECLLINV